MWPFVYVLGVEGVSLIGGAFIFPVRSPGAVSGVFGSLTWKEMLLDDRNLSDAHIFYEKFSLKIKKKLSYIVRNSLLQNEESRFFLH